MKNKKTIIVAAALFFAAAGFASAHQSRIVPDDAGGENAAIEVSEPEISQAFYDALNGKPKTYRIVSDKDINLYVSITQPKIEKPVSFNVRIYEIKDGKRMLKKSLYGSLTEWSEFYEPFAGDRYWEGESYEATVPAGAYEIEVGSWGNQGKYALAIGKKESFPPGEMWRTIGTIPALKRDFFGTSPATFALSIVGGAYLALTLIIGIVLAAAARYLMGKGARKKAAGAKNIGIADRAARAVIGIVLLVVGLYGWNPIVFILAGFMFYQALSRWCILYAAAGRNTCPTK